MGSNRAGRYGHEVLATLYAFLEAHDLLHLFKDMPAPDPRMVPDSVLWRAPCSAEAQVHRNRTKDIPAHVRKQQSPPAQNLPGGPFGVTHAANQYNTQQFGLSLSPTTAGGPPGGWSSTVMTAGESPVPYRSTEKYSAHHPSPASANIDEEGGKSHSHHRATWSELGEDKRTESSTSKQGRGSGDRGVSSITRVHDPLAYLATSDNEDDYF